MFQSTVIIPTTGNDFLKRSLTSVLSQTTPTKCMIVIDGPEYYDKSESMIEEIKSKSTEPLISICKLPSNVGGNGFYGHRIYASFSHLIDTDYILYLDEDNWYDLDHVESNINNIQNQNLEYSFSLRKIWRRNELLFNDDCESLGKWPSINGLYHVDTNAWCIKTSTAIKAASSWHGGWGQDRVFFSKLKSISENFDCTGKYTLNYALEGNEESVQEIFFKNGNSIQEKKLGEFPWRR